MKAMILAAGMGTRLKPLTDTMPKALVPVGGRPLLDILLHKLARFGFDDVTINVHHFAEQIKAFIASHKHDYPLHIHISDETDELLETGGALLRARECLLKGRREAVLIHNVDILSNADLQKVYAQHRSTDWATLLVSPRQSTRTLVYDEQARLVGWQRSDTGEQIGPYLSLDSGAIFSAPFSGIHIVSPEFLEQLPDSPTRFPVMPYYLDHCRHRDIRVICDSKLQLLDVGKLNVLDTAEHFLRDTAS